MIQRICTSNNLKSFGDEVNGFLKDGWTIVPGTLSTNISSYEGSTFSDPKVFYVCSVAIQHEDASNVAIFPCYCGDEKKYMVKPGFCCGNKDCHPKV
jgi:hypothetical protein